MLRLTDLSFGFRHRRLFADLNLTVRAGELIHMAGGNGAGKSTCMAIVAGLLGADRGSVHYFPDAGKDAAGDRRRYLEYMPAEANGLYLRMSAVHNLIFWSSLRGRTLPHADACTALAPWNLDHPLLRDTMPIDKFSTGMKRRLALARLSLSPAPCWLLDEPVYGLDADAMAIFHQQLSRHLTSGGLALVISHDLKPLAGLVSQTITLGS